VDERVDDCTCKSTAALACKKPTSDKLSCFLLQPKYDPHTGELMLFHMTFLPPYLSYSVVPSTHTPTPSEKKVTPRLLAAPVPISAPRMMHDMAASRTHSILLDTPLSLDPRNLALGKPVIGYEPASPTRFGVFPRHAPNLVRWYLAPACIIFHTAFAYDEYTANSPESLAAVNLVCCRLNSPRLVYSAGNLMLPKSQELPAGAKEACELYYYRFPTSNSASQNLEPSHQFPLASIPFEFPTVPQDRVVGPAKYVYGCSIKHGNFDAALGGAAKIDCLVKINATALIQRGIKRAEAGKQDAETPVDQRTIAEVLSSQTPRGGSKSSSSATEIADSDDVAIRLFELPPLHYAQEPSFVPRSDPRAEDDGFLLTYVFDERQIDPVSGRPFKDARSELWVVDAWDMRTVIARVKLPQRGKYLHSTMSGTARWLTDLISRSSIRSARSLVRSRRPPTSTLVSIHSRSPDCDLIDA
jgi:carotenoid cleavage dioxygenase-like enzyme